MLNGACDLQKYTSDSLENIQLGEYARIMNGTVTPWHGLADRVTDSQPGCDLPHLTND